MMNDLPVAEITGDYKESLIILPIFGKNFTELCTCRSIGMSDKDRNKLEIISSANWSDICAQIVLEDILLLKDQPNIGQMHLQRMFVLVSRGIHVREYPRSAKLIDSYSVH